MERVSHLKLMSMGLLQTCSYVTEQMQSNVKIDINKFLQAFSIEVDGHHVHPPSWTEREQDSVTSSSNQSHAQIQQMTSTSTPPSTNFLNIDNYCVSRQAEAIRWINLQERRSSIISRVQPTTAEQYQHLRDNVTLDSGPFRRTAKATKGT